MAKTPKARAQYVCQQCGHASPRWLGRCAGCGEWNSLAEEPITSVRRGASPASSVAVPVALGEVRAETTVRRPIGIDEFDRVLGGGVVAGAVTLLAGEPGIGKSTLLIQALASVASQGLSTLYVSGEESAAQIALRARRLGAPGMSEVQVLATTRLEDVEAALGSARPSAVVVDSIQTVRAASLESAAGSVGQLREVANRLIELAKSRDIALFLIGHVTKEGAIAGPKVLEHLVDTVLSFEGDRGHAFRLVRTAKNRFGPAGEIGVFEMLQEGLREVADPSALFLTERAQRAAGSVVVSTAEGSRPLLVELQALVAPAVYGSARRVASGLDANRLAILLAVLERKAGVHVLDRDVFASVTGGARVEERALDLALALAVVSSLRDKAVPGQMVIFGEVGLAGEVRAVQRAALRVAEARKLGFHQVVLPHANAEQLTKAESTGVKLIGVKTLGDALELIS